MYIVTPTDRPKSVRNRCVIEVFGVVFVFSSCFLDCSVGVGAFVVGLSQISSFFMYKYLLWNLVLLSFERREMIVFWNTSILHWLLIRFGWVV